MKKMFFFNQTEFLCLFSYVLKSTNSNNKRWMLPMALNNRSQFPLHKQ